MTPDVSNAVEILCPDCPAQRTELPDGFFLTGGDHTPPTVDFHTGCGHTRPTMSAAGPPQGEGLANERDFYRRLLDLGSQREIEPLLDQALALIVEVTGASMAYLELHDDDSSQPRY